VSEIRIIGVPRSGTNLARFIIETQSNITGVFNKSWWKHAIVPPLMAGPSATIDETPTIVMFREDPIEQIVSLFNFASKGRKAISGASEVNAFIQSPIIMMPHAGEDRFRFSSPVEYLWQYYWRILDWGKSDKTLLSIESLVREPAAVAQACRFLRPEAEIHIQRGAPDGYLGRNIDGPPGSRLLFETGTSLAKESSRKEMLAQSIEPGVRSAVLDRLGELYGLLRAVSQRSTGTAP
jgi:hypothetical protein